MWQIPMSISSEFADGVQRSITQKQLKLVNVNMLLLFCYSISFCSNNCKALCNSMQLHRWQDATPFTYSLFELGLRSPWRCFQSVSLKQTYHCNHSNHIPPKLGINGRLSWQFRFGEVKWSVVYAGSESVTRSRRWKRNDIRSWLVY